MLLHVGMTDFVPSPFNVLPIFGLLALLALLADGQRFECGDGYCDNPQETQCVDNDRCRPCPVTDQFCFSLPFTADHCVAACYRYLQRGGKPSANDQLAETPASEGAWPWKEILLVILTCLVLIMATYIGWKHVKKLKEFCPLMTLRVQGGNQPADRPRPQQRINLLGRRDGHWCPSHGRVPAQGTPLQPAPQGRAPIDNHDANYDVAQRQNLISPTDEENRGQSGLVASGGIDVVSKHGNILPQA